MEEYSVLKVNVISRGPYAWPLEQELPIGPFDAEVKDEGEVLLVLGSDLNGDLSEGEGCFCDDTRYAFWPNEVEVVDES